MHKLPRKAARKNSSVPILNHPSCQGIKFTTGFEIWNLAFQKKNSFFQTLGKSGCVFSPLCAHPNRACHRGTTCMRINIVRLRTAVFLTSMPLGARRCNSTKRSIYLSIFVWEVLSRRRSTILSRSTFSPQMKAIVGLSHASDFSYIHHYR
jgi:hypothetical protein